MPNYADYLCKTCNELFEYEKEYGVDFPQDPPCPKCGAQNTRRKSWASLIVPDHMKAVNDK
jgi:uncharacterized C2H2 Zn-finger protein